MYDKTKILLIALCLVYFLGYFFLSLGVACALLMGSYYKEDMNTRVAFYCIVTATGILYINLLLSAMACMYHGHLLIGFLSVSYGVMLPASAVTILGSSIYLAASNAVEFPAILGIVAGGLLLLFYVSLLLYDRQYQRSSYDHGLKYTTGLSGRIEGTSVPLVADSVVNINRYHFKFQ